MLLVRKNNCLAMPIISMDDANWSKALGINVDEQKEVSKNESPDELKWAETFGFVKDADE